MKSKETLLTLLPIMAAQWSLVTTTQATACGVTRLQLARLTDDGFLERVAHGVYRHAGSTPTEFDGIRIAWLTTQPGQSAETRLRAPLSTPVVSGTSAASLHNIGVFRNLNHEFTTTRRRQSQRLDVRFTVRQLESMDVTVRQGLPVTVVERTIADLVADRHDLSHVARALGDGLALGSVDLTSLARHLGPLAARNGFKKGDGLRFVQELLALAGLDAPAIVARITDMDGIATLISEKFFQQVGQEVLQLGGALKGSVLEQVFESLGTSFAAIEKFHRLAPRLKTDASQVQEVDLDLWSRMTMELAPALEALSTVTELMDSQWRASENQRNKPENMVSSR
jgi:Transcriptional regulator, AbiEi antitoxin